MDSLFNQRYIKDNYDLVSFKYNVFIKDFNFFYLMLNKIKSILNKKNISNNNFKLNIFILNLKLFLIKNISLKKILFFSKKFIYLDMGLFIVNSGLSIQNYRFNKNILLLNKNIYFFNINKIIFIINQFSSFLFKIINLRGIILIVSFDKTDISYIKKLSNNLGLFFIIGNWINGFFTNWIYFYRRLWNLEDSFLKGLSNNVILESKFLGLRGLRNIPDFIFILNSGIGLSIHNLLIESFKYSIPVSSIVNLNDDLRYMIYPLFGDNSNKWILKFYQLIFLNIYKLAVSRRILNK